MESKRDNPFPGLRSFHPQEEALFFGRDGQKNELLRRLKRNRMIAVLGSSGSGKSSLIKAGLVPTLHNGFRTRSGSDWHIASLTPGNAPIARLANALSDIVVSENTDRNLTVTITETTLRRSALGISEVIRQNRTDGNILVLVDQFEELFRVKPDPDSPHLENEATAFVNLILEAASQQSLPIYIVLTMRSDYLGDCARFVGLPEAINRGQYLIPRLTREQRRQVIEGPIKLRGEDISSRLVHRLLNDVGDNPDQLPILQHAMMRTWDRWEGIDRGKGPIDLQHYEDIGTMTSALEWHADEAYNELDDRKKAAAELMFKRLTEKRREHGEDRHPTTVKDVCAVTELPIEEVTAIVDCFRGSGRSFLMPEIDKQLTPYVVLDISHESLIRVWQRLRVWVEQESIAATDYLRLIKRMEDYQADKDSLLGNPALQLALTWRNTNRPNQAWAQRYDARFDEATIFLDQSQAAHLQQKAERKAAAKRELEQAQSLAKEQRQRLDEQQRAAKRMRAFTIAILLLGILAGVFGVWAYIQGQQAELQARRSQSFELANAALDTIAVNSGLSVELALKAVEIAQSAGDEVSDEAINALNRSLEMAMSQSFITNHTAAIVDALFTLDGSRVVTASEDGTVKIWNTQTRQVDHEIPVGKPIASIDLNNANNRMVVATTDGIISIWTLSGEEPVHQWQAHDGKITKVIFNPDGSSIASSGRDGAVRLWDTESTSLLFSMEQHTAPVGDLAFNLDGSRVVSASWDTNVIVWNSATGKAEHILSDHDAAVATIEFSPDGKLLASAGWDSSVRLWDIETGNIRSTLSGHGAAVVSVAFTPDSTRLASASWDNNVRLWDVESGQLLRIFRGNTKAVTQVAFSPSGEHLAAAGWDATTRLWSLSTDLLWRSQDSHTDWINVIAFNPAGTSLVSAGEDKRVVIWDVESIKGSSRLANFQDWREHFAFSRDSALIATIVPGEIQVLDYRTGNVIHRILGIDSTVTNLAFSDDAKRIAVVDINHRVRKYHLSIDNLVDAARKFVVALRLSDEELDYAMQKLGTVILSKEECLALVDKLVDEVDSKKKWSCKPGKDGFRGVATYYD